MMPDYYNNSQQTWQGPKGGQNQSQGGKYVWWDRNWVPYDANNPNHKGLPMFDTYMNIAPGSTPYYANDVTSALMQNAFPGAASGYAFGSSYLEPQRQQNIREMMNLQTQGGASNASDAYQKSLQQRAYGNTAQTGAGLYGPGGGGKQFKASNLLANMNQANTQGAQYRAQATDPMGIAARRNATIMQGFQNPMADAVRGWIPGLEPARQNNNFWGQLAGAAGNFLPYLNFGGGGNKNGGGGNGFYRSW